MRSSLKALALGLAVALLCVPAAFAKGSHEHGKPAWAGGGGGGDHGRPAWAGHGKSHEKKAKHEKKHQKAESQDGAAQEQASGDGELNLEDLNPAWFCKMTFLMMDGREAGSFADKYGTNENSANAFGKCVSERAHELHSGEASGGSSDEQSCESGDQSGSGDQAGSGEETSSDGSVTDTTASGDVASGDVTSGDVNSGDTSDDSGNPSGECQNDGAAGEPTADGGDETAGQDDQAEQDDQGEDSDAQREEDDQGEQTEAAAFAKALLRYVTL